jgi:hypothetical protein
VGRQAYEPSGQHDKADLIWKIAGSPGQCGSAASRGPTSTSNATIYLEATASDWEPADRVAKLLRAIGIAKVRGSC